MTFKNKLRGILWGRSVKDNYRLQDGQRMPRKTLPYISGNNLTAWKIEKEHSDYRCYRVFLAISFLFGKDGAIEKRIPPSSNSPLSDEQAATAAKGDWLLSNKSKFSAFLSTYCTHI